MEGTSAPATPRRSRRRRILLAMLAICLVLGGVAATFAALRWRLVSRVYRHIAHQDSAIDGGILKALQAGDFVTVEKECTAVIDTGRHTDIHHIQRARARLQLGDLNGALTDHEAYQHFFHEHEVEFLLGHFNRAEILAKLDRKEEARVLIDDASTLNEKHAYKMRSGLFESRIRAVQAALGEATAEEQGPG